MSERPQNHKTIRQAAELNEHQQTRLRITCEHIDRLLGDIENALRSTTSQSPFPRYTVDVNPPQIRMIEDYIRRLRSQLLRTIAWQQMKPQAPDIPVTRAVLTNLAFIDIAIEELKPHYMKGSGPVPLDAVSELNGVVYELRSIVTGMELYLKRELGTDLAERLRRLEKTGSDVALLRFLEQVVTRHGLVELRQRISTLAARLEDDSFEVALFGRVSSGKSSLLNALLGTAVLPVGVNPVTAVPTKLRYGSVLKAAVEYGDSRRAEVTLEELAGLVSEQCNPGNLRNVVRAIVEIPAPRLKQGILLVDTPGLGSLATRGSAETRSYLPSCDLALLLIDAGATLNEEDIGTLRLLYEAGIPALVVLSKADLLGEEDLRRVISYIREHIGCDLGLDMPVHAVSAIDRYSVMLDDFYERELLPHFEQARALKEASTSRKIGALRGTVMSTMKVILDREVRKECLPSTGISDLESTLRVITGEVGAQNAALRRAFLEIGETPNSVLDLVVDRVVLWTRSSNVSYIPSLQIVEWIHESVRELAQQPVERLRNVGMRAVAGLQQAAQELGETDAPLLDDFDRMLRNLPRFETANAPAEMNVGHWNLLGERIARSRIKARMRDSIASILKDDLHFYGMALSQWSEQIAGRLIAMVNAYADAYRVQVQRISGSSDAVIDLDQLHVDLEVVRSWSSTSAVHFADSRA